MRAGGKWRESGALKSENTKETMVAEARKNKKILMIFLLVTAGSGGVIGN